MILSVEWKSPTGHGMELKIGGQEREKKTESRYYYHNNISLQHRRTTKRKVHACIHNDQYSSSSLEFQNKRQPDGDGPATAAKDSLQRQFFWFSIPSLGQLRRGCPVTNIECAQRGRFNINGRGSFRIITSCVNSSCSRSAAIQHREHNPGASVFSRRGYHPVGQLDRSLRRGTWILADDHILYSDDEYF